MIGVEEVFAAEDGATTTSPTITQATTPATLAEGVVTTSLVPLIIAPHAKFVEN